MRVLLLEEFPTTESAVSRQLRAAGHDVSRCSDDRGDGPCRAVHSDDACPLDRHPDVAVVVRERGTPDLLFAMGAVCAERHRVPVVRVGAGDADLGDVARAGAAAGLDRLEARYAAVVRTALGGDATVEATRSADCVRVSLRATTGPANGRQRTDLAERARKAIRSFDPFVPIVDIAVAWADTDADADWFVDDGDDLFGLR